MDTRALQRFYKVLGETLDNRWSENNLRDVAERIGPTGTLGRNEWILRADYSLTVGRWFVEGLVDLGSYAAGTGNIGDLFKDYLALLREHAPHEEQQEISKAARQLAAFAWPQVEARREAGRQHIDKDLREEVWFRNDPVQRCYLCGYRFSPDVKDLFLRRTRVKPSPHRLVDFTRPRGANWRHLRAEVDHIIPVAEGGRTAGDNLELACGWCNNVKRQLWSVYDAKAWARGTVMHPSLRREVTVPQPLWVLRIVAARARCEAPEGCGAQLKDHELFIAPRSPKGALTPTNLMVVCRKHDPWAGHRLISQSLLPKR